MPKQVKKTRSGHHGGTGKVRLIAGQWRGRQLEVVSAEGLRPSGDRTRETLFNWLQPYLPGAHCLDLFAGSGALGFEAASRGAGFVAMVEQDRQAVRCLQQNVERLAAHQVSVFAKDALACLSDRCPPDLRRAYDMIFVDPPWASQWQSMVLERLAHYSSQAQVRTQSDTNVLLDEETQAAAENQTKHEACIRLKPGGLVYIEANGDFDVRWPGTFEILREKRIGGAQVYLLKWNG